MGGVVVGGVPVGDLRVRRAVAEDALVVAALRLQAARAAGAATEPGFLDRFAAAWDPERHPTWVAERRGSHAGVLIAQVVTGLPWPGEPTERRLHLVTLHAPAGGDDADARDGLDSFDWRSDGSDVTTALTTAMSTWAQDAGLTPEADS